MSRELYELDYKEPIFKPIIELGEVAIAENIILGEN